MTNTVQLRVASNARDYSAMIGRYATETGKSISQALLREGPDFANELYKQFKAISPNPASIAAAARDRGWKMGRRPSSFVPAMAGLSEKADLAAQRVLGGDKSDLFRIVAGSLVPVRFSGRAKHRLLRGGRFGRRFAKSSLRASELSTGELAASLAEPLSKASPVQGTVGQDVKRLNVRALGTYYEVVFRQRGARGGFMASQWSYRRWKSSGAGKPAELVNKDADGAMTGRVNFQTGASGEVENILLTGLIPGTAAQMERHGILARVAAVRTPALANAILLHARKVAQTHGLSH